MKRFVIALMLCVLLLVTVVGYRAGYASGIAAGEAARLECGAGWYQTMGALRIALERLDAPCLEDMPCWDCATMGNGVCGE